MHQSYPQPDSNNDGSTNTNGHAQQQPDQEYISERLQDELTIGYRPVLPLESMWLGGTDMPQITLRRDIELMQYHPIVITALEYYKSGIAGAEFWGGPDHANSMNEQGKPVSLDPKVSMFVMAQVERFWQRAIPIIQEGGYMYGWCPGEHVYKEVNRLLCWSHLKTFHPNDGFILTLDYQPIGVRIKNIRAKQPVDMWLGSETIPAKAFWYAHRPRFNQHYGRTQFLGGWRAWRRLGFRDALEQIIDAASYRAGYCGPIVYYPPGHTAPTAQIGISATRVDAQGSLRRENRDIARQYSEWAKAGASFALSSECYPDTQGGGKKWEVVWPEHVMDVGPLIKQAEYLENQILLGMGVPPELVRPGGTGSGYSGRSVPREAFLDGQQKIADAMLQNFVEQVLKPLVLWNFGPVPFDVQCKSLLKAQSENKTGMDQNAQGPEAKGNPHHAQNNPTSNPKPAGGIKPQQPAPQQDKPQQVMSLENTDPKVTDIVRRVLQKSR